jgi:hypothetical protein
MQALKEGSPQTAIPKTFQIVHIINFIKGLFDQVDFSAIRSDKNNQDRGKSTESINLVIATPLCLVLTSMLPRIFQLCFPVS